eukprot:836057-Amphidinium_carterae.1
MRARQGLVLQCCWELESSQMPCFAVFWGVQDVGSRLGGGGLMRYAQGGSPLERSACSGSRGYQAVIRWQHDLTYSASVMTP